MLIRVGEVVLNLEQLVRVELKRDTADGVDGARADVLGVSMASGNYTCWRADSVEGLAVAWWLTEATLQQRMKALTDSRSLALDVVALYRRQPQL